MELLMKRGVEGNGQLDTPPKKPWISVGQESVQLCLKPLQFLDLVGPAGTAII
jgi:hypothetical protein